MFLNIFYTFCKMIFLTMLLLCAFALAFYMSFYDPSKNFEVRTYHNHAHLRLVLLSLLAEISLCLSCSSFSQNHDNDYRRV